ncbi:MAG: ribulose-bisphosphate carboxylase large subunit family protein [Tepidisphaeraceae bacterium]
MPAERIVATYRVETPLEIERAAAVLAGEQSSGTFVAVPGETDELRNHFRARVERVTENERVPSPSIPGARTSDTYRRGEIAVSWSLENVGYNLPTLVSTLQGNLYELREFSGLKLLDIDFPPSFADVFRGPRFGIAGTRRLTGVQGRPMIGTIIKPSVGMSPEETARLVATLASAGIDFIKDDELMADPPHSPFDRRVDAVMRVINDHAERTGKRVMYAFNVSDELDAMLEHYDRIVDSEGTAAMVSLNSVGLTAVKKLCDHGGKGGALAIHGHRNGWGMMNRHPLLGIEFAAYQKLWRLAGVDQIHVNGIANKFWEDDDSVVRSIEACLRPMLGGMPILPVVSSGQTGLQAPETYRRTKTIDLLYMAGGGIMAHPSGPAAGVAALRQAWEAAMAGVEINEFAKTHSELRQQIEKFGKR